MVFSYLTIAQILWWLALNINLFVLLVLEIRYDDHDMLDARSRMGTRHVVR
jgi:predicted secreted protein